MQQHRTSTLSLGTATIFWGLSASGGPGISVVCKESTWVCYGSCFNIIPQQHKTAALSLGTATTFGLQRFRLYEKDSTWFCFESCAHTGRFRATFIQWWDSPRTLACVIDPAVLILGGFLGRG